jgi:hypothetical protein
MVGDKTKGLFKKGQAITKSSFFVVVLVSSPFLWVAKISSTSRFNAFWHQRRIKRLQKFGSYKYEKQKKKKSDKILQNVFFTNNFGLNGCFVFRKPWINYFFK